MNKSERNQERVKERLLKYKLINTTLEAGLIFCNLHHHLKKSGKIIPAFDLFIAALAIEHGNALLTRDAHFKDIPGLPAEII